MTDPRKYLSQALGGVPVSPDLNMDLLTRELTRLTMTERQAWVKAEQEAKNRAAQERHDTIAQRLPAGTLLDVFIHHAPQLPRPGYILSEPYCTGCDGRSYDNDPVDWPCSTWLLIERAEKRRAEQEEEG